MLLLAIFLSLWWPIIQQLYNLPSNVFIISASSKQYGPTVVIKYSQFFFYLMYLLYSPSGLLKHFEGVFSQRKGEDYRTKNVFMAQHPVTQQDFFLDTLLGAANEECVKAGAWTVWNLQPDEAQHSAKMFETRQFHCFITSVCWFCVRVCACARLLRSTHAALICWPNYLMTVCGVSARHTCLVKLLYYKSP